MDNLSPDRRSLNMSRIRSKGMKPEMVVRRIAHSMGYRYRLHCPSLPGKPDLVFRSLRRIIEVRGCFWHQHPGCIDAHIPKTRRAYWKPKLKGNVRRDVQNAQALTRLGWRLLVLWECEILSASSGQLRNRLRKFLGRY